MSRIKDVAIGVYIRRPYLEILVEKVKAELTDKVKVRMHYKEQMWIVVDYDPEIGEEGRLNITLIDGDVYQLVDRNFPHEDWKRVEEVLLYLLGEYDE